MHIQTLVKKYSLPVFFLILYVKTIAQPALVRQETFEAPSVGFRLKYTVVLPASYNKAKTEKYPVVYLLHGHTGNYTSWISYAQLPVGLATQHDCIIILPDGGNSWYVNWSGQTDGKPHRWEDMLVKDLIPEVDKKFKTATDKKHRAIGGLSMGGFGALSVGLKNVRLFGFVFSSAGAIDFCRNIKNEIARDTLDWNSPQLWSDGDRTIDVTNFSTQKERTPQGLVFATARQANEYDPYVLLEKADTVLLPHLHLDCGSKDDFIKDAFGFVEKVKAKTTRYSFALMPGEHEVPYWEQAIRHTFLVMEQQRFFNRFTIG